MDKESLLSAQVAYYKARAAEYDDWWERRFEYDLGEGFNRLWQAETEDLRRTLLEFGPRGGTFHVVKRYWLPSRLQTELADMGWRATVRNTRWAFIHGTATSVRVGEPEG
jgi:hypothetical protein